MADNQQVKIKATADTARIEGKLDKLATQLDFVAAKSRKVGGDSKKAGTDAGDGFGKANKGAEAFKNTLMAYAGPAALLAGLVMTVKKLADEYARLEKLSAAQSMTAGQTLSSVSFGTGLIGQAGGMQALEDAMRKNKNLLTPQQEYQIFNVISSEDVRGNRTFDEEISMSARIADTVPMFEQNAANIDKISKDIGTIYATGAFSEDEALARGTYVAQAKGKNENVMNKLEMMLLNSEGANLTAEETKQFTDSVLAMQMAMAQGGVRSTSAGSVFDTINDKMVKELEAKLKGEGLSEAEILTRLASGTETRSRKIVDIINRAAEGDVEAIAQIEKATASGGKISKALGQAPTELANLRGANFEEMIAGFQEQQTTQSALAIGQSAAKNQRESGLAFNPEAQVRGILRERASALAEQAGAGSSILESSRQFVQQFDGFTTPKRSENLPGVEQITLERIARLSNTTPEQAFMDTFGNLPQQAQADAAEFFPSLNITITTDENTNVIQAD